MAGNATEEFGLVHKLYEWYKLLHADVNRYPKTERYSLGEKLKSQALELIDGLWQANSLPLPERLVRLDHLQRVLDLSKLLIRLVRDIGIYKVDGYLYRQERLQEIGRMLGSWRKNTRKKLGIDP